MIQFTVILDACVLYPAPLRDLLMHLALTDLIRVKWTDAIHDEWTNSLLKSRPDLKPDQLQRTRDLMNTHIRDCLVTGYENLIPTLTLPDPDDRHVLAAALTCGADAIVTFHLKDFPDEVLKPYALEAIHPDDFFVVQLELAPSKICVAVRNHRASLKNPPKDVQQYLTTLEAQGLVRTVLMLWQFADRL